MAITKVSQLARLSNSVLIQALTNRSFNDFGQMLGPDDIFEVSYKNGNKPGYYSVGASVSDIRFDLVGKYSASATNQENQTSIKPILTYDSRYANRYQEGDLLFYPKQNGLTLIRKTDKFDNNNGASAPSDTNIAPYGLTDISGCQWQYAVLPWDSWMVPLFSTIKTVGKIQIGYWQEVLPYKLFPEPIFTAAYGELNREFNSVINSSANTINNFNNINSTTPSANSIYNIMTAGVSGVYNFDSDRYILKIDATGKTNSDITGILANIAANCGSSGNNIKMPFFAFTVSSADINYISVPYYTLSSTEPNRHIYCCLGNTVSADTSSYNISPVWAYEMIKNKETKLSSYTLNITPTGFETSASRTGINLKNPIAPLSLTNNGNLQLNIGDGLTIIDNSLHFDDTALVGLSGQVSALHSKVDYSVSSLSSEIDSLSSEVYITIDQELESIRQLIQTNNRKLQTTLYGRDSLN